MALFDGHQYFRKEWVKEKGKRSDGCCRKKRKREWLG